jgi:hypothetical protein
MTSSNQQRVRNLSNRYVSLKSVQGIYLCFTAVWVAIVSIRSMYLLSIFKEIYIWKGHNFRGSQNSGICMKRLKCLFRVILVMQKVRGKVRYLCAINFICFHSPQHMSSVVMHFFAHKVRSFYMFCLDEIFLALSVFIPQNAPRHVLQ